jgi:hypothetical protein
LRLLGVVGAFAVISTIGNRTHGADVVIVGWVVLVLASLLLVPLHELGHLLAARFVGARAYAVDIGLEPWLLERTWAGVHWRIGKVPGGGVAYHGPCDGRFQRLRYVFIASGGVVMNLLVSILAFATGQHLSADPDRSLAVLVCYAIAMASALQFLNNLWPHAVESSAGRLKSDGAKIMSLFRGAPLDAQLMRAIR